jgi:hypothetical protein
LHNIKTDYNCGGTRVISIMPKDSVWPAISADTQSPLPTAAAAASGGFVFGVATGSSSFTSNKAGTSTESEKDSGIALEGM